MKQSDRPNITIYIPAALKHELKMLPPRSVSRICRQALQDAVDDVKHQRLQVVAEAFEED